MDDEESTVETDGGYGSNPLVETRERLATVEQGQEQLLDTVESIDEKVDDVRHMVRNVDDRNLSRSRFEDEWRGTIEEADKYLTVVKWVAGAIILLAALFQIFVFSGVFPT